jgi:hypothetical protein
MLSVLLAYVPGAMARQSSKALLKVIQHAEPPATCQANSHRWRCTREVREFVSDVVVESGHPLLRPAAEENVRTWKFASHTPGTFYVTFRYKFAWGGTEVTFLGSPSIGQIETTPMMISGGCQVIWKTQLNSACAGLKAIFLLWRISRGNGLGRRGEKNKSILATTMGIF